MGSIPDVKDYSQRQAEALLKALGFTNVLVQQVPAEFESIVVSLEHRGKDLSPGQKIAKASPLVLKVGSGMGLPSTVDEYNFESSADSVDGIDEIFE